MVSWTGDLSHGHGISRHEALMRYAGHRADAKYPGYSSEPLDAFRHLATDLRSFGGDFMFGGGATIIAASRGSWDLSRPKPDA
jgi:hypothetical protein